MCGVFFLSKLMRLKRKLLGKNPAIFDHLQFHSKLVQVLQWRDGKKPNLAGRVRYHISKKICYTPGDTLGRLFTRSYNIPGDQPKVFVSCDPVPFMVVLFLYRLWVCRCVLWWYTFHDGWTPNLQEYTKTNGFPWNHFAITRRSGSRVTSCPKLLQGD